MSVLVWIEQSGDDAVTSCWEVLGKGRELANELGSPWLRLSWEMTMGQLQRLRLDMGLIRCLTHRMMRWQLIG